MVSVKILGTGCAKCNKLYSEAERAAAACGVEAALEKVDKLDDIMAYGVMITPALVIDGEVKSSGKIPSQAQITNWLTTAAMAQK